MLGDFVQMNNFFPGICCGIIIFQTAIVAPILALELKGNVFSSVVRTIWPRFFLSLAIASGCGLLVETFTNGSSIVRITVLSITIILPTICYGLIPATNAATDAGRERRFRTLHITSIVLTIFSLLFNAACIWL